MEDVRVLVPVLVLVSVPVPVGDTMGEIIVLCVGRCVTVDGADG